MKKLTKEDREDLIIFLEEYLLLCKSNKKHKVFHKKEKCPKCEYAKRLIRKLKE